MSTTRVELPPPTVIGQILRSFRGIVAAVALFSALINLLALTGSLFMLQVYDRVLASRSIPTLVALSILTIGLYAIQGALEVIRSRVLVRVGCRVEQRLAPRVYALILRLPLRTRIAGDGMVPVRDLDVVRSFLSGPGPTAILDMPWLPIYLGFVFMLHPDLGLLATFGALVLVGLTIATELLSKAPAKGASAESATRAALAGTAHRNAEVIEAMGLGANLMRRWLSANDRYLSAQRRASDVVGGLSSASRVFRAMLQSAILGLGAYLVIRGEVSAGAIIASSITSARALSPIETAIANWKAFVGARHSRKRLEDLFAALPDAPEPLTLPNPSRNLAVEGLAVTAPGRQGLPIISNVSLELKAGQGVGIIGPSAAGKSTLARALVGVWPAVRGTVRLDGAALDQFSAEGRGRHIGYLPQDIELFDGTVADNIARLDADPDPQAIVAAARAADVHDMILRLPDGYQTRVGEGGSALSAGQRQRVALARALYKDPFLLVLDEPNSNLDSDGEAALTQAIRSVRDRGGIVIVIAHRPSAIAAVDLLAVMANGVLQAFGPKDEVLRHVLPKAQAPLRAAHSNLAVVPEEAKAS
jgi:ATP-binding cassette subfamily C protein